MLGIQISIDLWREDLQYSTVKRHCLLWADLKAAQMLDILCCNDRLMMIHNSFYSHIYLPGYDLKELYFKLSVKTPSVELQPPLGIQLQKMSVLKNQWPRRLFVTTLCSVLSSSFLPNQSNISGSPMVCSVFKMFPVVVTNLIHWLCCEGYS